MSWAERDSSVLTVDALAEGPPGPGLRSSNISAENLPFPVLLEVWGGISRTGAPCRSLEGMETSFISSPHPPGRRTRIPVRRGDERHRLHPPTGDAVARGPKWSSPPPADGLRDSREPFPSRIPPDETHLLLRDHQTRRRKVLTLFPPSPRLRHTVSPAGNPYGDGSGRAALGRRGGLSRKGLQTRNHICGGRDRGRFTFT
jgi:hypothetical protein